MLTVRSVAALLFAGSVGLFACNDVPVKGVLDSFSVQVTDSRSNTDPVKLDFLWVIDNSVSMCQEQNALADNISTFLSKLESFVNVDVRLAVVTTDGLSESERGKFHNKLPDPFPPNCLERESVSCLQDSDCAKALDGCVPTPSKWVCEPPGQGAQYLTNKNGSINSTCRFYCADDAECKTEFEPQLTESTYQCKAPGNDQSLRGCLKPPAVQGCPADLPEYVDAKVAKEMGYTVPELFRCMAIVGALQDQNPQLEMGLKTSVLALDTTGPNAKQAQQFLRPDAYQVVVFVSDEEDCSTAEVIPPKFRDKNGNLQAEYRQVCGLLGDTDGEGPLGEDLSTSTFAPSSPRDPSGKGPLEPVSTYVNKLRSINPDPSRVLVAAIVGDVVVAESALPKCSKPGVPYCPDEAFETTDDCVQERVEQYLISKGGLGPLARNTFVCESAVGKADWGGRYLQLVKAFGKNGVTTNLCSPAGFADALDRIADTILRRVIRICLDEPIKLGTDIQVTKTFEDGSLKVLEAGEELDYVLRQADDCGSGRAVFFNDVLAPNQKVDISYEAPLIETTNPTP